MSTATLTAQSFPAREWRGPCIAYRPLVFALTLVIVGAISVYDGYLVIRTGDMIREFERNPAGLWLLQINHGDPTLFLITKGIGTSIVLAAMTILYRRCRRLAIPVASGLLLFQTGLLVFLERT